MKEEAHSKSIKSLGALILYIATVSAAYCAAPTPPVNPVATVKKGKVTISWSAPSSDGGSRIRKYTAVATQDGANCSVTNANLTTNRKTKKCSIRKLSPVVRTFRVYARNKHGVSEPSRESNPVVASRSHVDAACGISHGLIMESAPSALTDLCLSGLSTTPLAQDDGRYIWSCVGLGAGRSVQCNSLPQTPISPIPLGHIYIQEFPFGPFSLVNIETGALTPQKNVDCGGLTTAAALTDGTVVGAKLDGSVYKVDPVSGVCKSLFKAPEEIGSLAAAPNGDIVMQSFNDTYGKKQIYRFSLAGDKLSNVALDGIDSLGGIAFAQTGRLYGAGIYGFNDVRWYELNPFNGSISEIARGNALALSEICIDSAGIAYGHSRGSLYKYEAATGKFLGSLTLQRDMGLGAIVCR